MCQRSGYTGVLNIPGLLICWDPEYASGSEYVRVLDIPQFQIFQGNIGF